ncbi:MAG: hypothetical protein MJ152_02685, partial [Clostridia bacterium]|nr:hypothetical protein [Clostridia bacterium]
KELVAHFWAKTQENKNVFPDTMTPIEKIKTAFRLGGKGVATKVSNFPMDTIDKIIRYYNVNDNYYDFSCGWGVRLASALKHNVNYFGTDPNYLLVERLEQYAKDYHKLCFNSSIVDIRCQGSEHFVKEWENKIGLAFSSPPYFYLEDYKIGDQSFKQGTSYQSWLDNYMRPTIKNIYRYLIDNGYFLMNINNFDKFKLCEDVLNIATSEGFELYCCHTLTNISRCVGQKGKDGVNFNDNNEKIMVFIKKQHKLANEKIGDFETEQGFELSIFDFKEN